MTPFALWMFIIGSLITIKGRAVMREIEREQKQKREQSSQESEMGKSVSQNDGDGTKNSSFDRGSSR